MVIVQMVPLHMTYSIVVMLECRFANQTHYDVQCAGDGHSYQHVQGHVFFASTL